MQDANNALLEILAAQRNTALNELAKAQASLSIVMAENERLTKELADKAGETAPVAIPEKEHNGNDQPV